MYEYAAGDPVILKDSTGKSAEALSFSDFLFDVYFVDGTVYEDGRGYLLERRLNAYRECKKRQAARARDLVNWAKAIESHHQHKERQNAERMSRDYWSRARPTKPFGHYQHLEHAARVLFSDPVDRLDRRAAEADSEAERERTAEDLKEPTNEWAPALPDAPQSSEESM